MKLRHCLLAVLIAAGAGMATSVMAGRDAAVQGGLWADSADNQAGNQGVTDSRERIRRAESAPREQLRDSKQRTRDNVDEALRERRQENRIESRHLQDRATGGFGRGGF